MCGRYSIGKDPVRITLARAEATFHFPEVFNAAPSQSLPVILCERGQLVSRPMRWGFTRAGRPIIINARAETIAQTFSGAIHSRRCLIPANGFYEWEKSAHGPLPWRFHLRTGHNFCFAGIYEQTVSAEHLQMELEDTDAPPASCIQESFAIVTQNPNALVKKIHNRMPAIVTPGHYGVWLEYGTPGGPPAEAYPRGFGTLHPRPADDPYWLALEPAPAEAMTSYRVGKSVNNVRNNTSECFKPV